MTVDDLVYAAWRDVQKPDGYRCDIDKGLNGEWCLSAKWGDANGDWPSSGRVSAGFALSGDLARYADANVVRTATRYLQGLLDKAVALPRPKTITPPQIYMS